jgi:hypothetical protein
VGSRVHRVRQGRLDRKGLQVLLDQLDKLDHVVTPDHLARLELLDHLVNRVLQELMVDKVRPEILVSVEQREQQDRLDLLETPEQLGK